MRAKRLGLMLGAAALVSTMAYAKQATPPKASPTARPSRQPRNRSRKLFMLVQGRALGYPKTTARD